MNKIKTYCLLMLTMMVCGIMGACSDFDPEGMPDVPNLPKVTDMKAAVVGHKINVSWTLPQTDLEIEGLRLIPNGNSNATITLPADATNYMVSGQPMGEDYFYTVKVCYKGGYVSEGTSVNVVLPQEDLPGVTDLKAEVNGRTVKLTWTMPVNEEITGVRIIRDGDTSAATVVPGNDVTSFEMKAQPMDQTMTYTVQAIYDDYYMSNPADVEAYVAYINPRLAFLLLADNYQALPDDDERAAAAWFATLKDADFITPTQLSDIDIDVYPVLWIEVDRVGLPMGWENLPSNLVSSETIAALKHYTQNGGSLYLANFATQLTVPLGIVPDNMAPTCYGNGEGGTGTDVWVINPYLGWDFRNGSDQGFYDRTYHEIFKDITLEDPNNYGYPNIPLIGPGQREDHNCLWDCNIYGRGNQADVIRNFEVTTNSLVLATWGHVRDHCVAGLVEFYSNAEHGRVVANGFAAYEWNQNSGTNPYQHNIEQLTLNILNYLK